MTSANRPENKTVPKSSQSAKLAALLDGTPVGLVYQTPAGQFRFVYDKIWRTRTDAYPISLSMPLTAAEHSHSAINAFLWGLLPDNTSTLEHYARIFGVSSGNPVALLSHIGADCAGAVQFIAPDQVETLSRDGNANDRIDWLTEQEVETELRTVRKRGVPGTSVRTVGQFSLAGAQPKIALLEENGRWGRPFGRIPTNRILKPPSPNFEGFAENEHFCLDLAIELELGSVQSRVAKFGSEVAIVVDRFDRRKNGDQYFRIHQEDTCQALGLLPSLKYEADGGPGIPSIVQLLRDSSQNADRDVERFLDAIALNWVLVATDAHAKNFALLHGAGGATRLAPFYDIASYLPYSDDRLSRVKLAMRMGGEYLVRRIGRKHWENMAVAIGLPPRVVVDRVSHIVERVQGLAPIVSARGIADGLSALIMNSLAHKVVERAKVCTLLLGAGS